MFQGNQPGALIPNPKPEPLTLNHKSSILNPKPKSRKASLKPETFEGLHLPLAVTGALVEDLFVDLYSDTKALAWVDPRP